MTTKSNAIQSSRQLVWCRSLSIATFMLLAMIGTVAQAHHRPGHGGGGSGGGDDTWSFHAETVGHVTGYYDSKEYSVSGDDHNLVFNKPGDNDFWLSDFFRDWDYNGRDGWECFTDFPGSPRNPGNEPNYNPNFVGTMQLYDGFGSDPDLAARFWFWAGNDPEDPADKLHGTDYVLQLYDYGQVWTGPFPPDQVAPSYRIATHWEILPKKKNLLRDEPCVTGGVVAFPAGEGVLLEVIQNP